MLVSIFQQRGRFRRFHSSAVALDWFIIFFNQLHMVSFSSSVPIGRESRRPCRNLSRGLLEFGIFSKLIRVRFDDEIRFGCCRICESILFLSSLRVGSIHTPRSLHWSGRLQRSVVPASHLRVFEAWRFGCFLVYLHRVTRPRPIVHPNLSRKIVS